MPIQRTFQQLEGLLIFTLGLGLFVSKPVIYSAGGALLLLALIKLWWDSQYRHDLLASRLTKACLALFLLGIIATAIHPSLPSEISWIARKSLYLPLLPVLYLAFKHKSVRFAGMSGVLIGFWITSILTMSNAGWQWTGGRVAGATWPVDVWGLLVGLFASFLLPLVFEQKFSWQLRALLTITWIASAGMLVLSGARGPWLGVAIASFVYLVFFQRKALGFLIILLVIGYFPAKHWAPDQVNYLESRITSMTKTAGPQESAQFDESNWVRLQLWKTSIAQDLHKLENTPLTFLFGSGPNNQIHEMRAFFKQWTGMPEADKERMIAYGYPTNEVHNMYLDAMGKMGILWTLSSLALLLAIILLSLRTRDKSDQAPLAVLTVTTCFLVTGGFYDILPHWGTFFLTFFTMLAIHLGKTNIIKTRTT